MTFQDWVGINQMPIVNPQESWNAASYFERKRCERIIFDMHGKTLKEIIEKIRGVNGQG